MLATLGLRGGMVARFQVEIEGRNYLLRIDPSDLR
jgi:hypothetical protein